MAIVDINFQEGDAQNFLLEFAAGARNAAADILTEADGSQYPVKEIAAASGGNNIFIMSE